MPLRNRIYALLWGWQSINLWQYRLPSLRYCYRLRHWVFLGQVICLLSLALVLTIAIALMSCSDILAVVWSIIGVWLWLTIGDIRFPTDVVQ